MRTLEPATIAYTAGAGGIVARLYVWIAAKNRDSGATETIGIWNGADTLTVTVEGEARVYYGAGSLLHLDGVVYEAGLNVRMHRVSFSGISPELRQAILGYEPRMAPIEVHRGLFDTDSGALIEAPHRLIRGWIDAVALPTAEVGGTSTCDLTIASSARALTRPLTGKYSDESLQARAPGDRLFRHADVSGDVSVTWNA